MLQSHLRSIKKIILTGASYIVCCSVVFASTSNSIEGLRVYPKNPAYSYQRSQMVASDIDRYRNSDGLWEALRHDFKLPHYEDNPLVQEKIEWFMSHQDFLYHSMSRAAPYLYFILQQVKKRNLPAEVMLLPIIESSYNPFAFSNRGAAGIWQMMPGTASDEGLKQNWWYDGRRDVIASTRGALNHLAYLQSFFDGNWLLAMAAYNTGEGNVLSAIRRNINAGENTDFWSLPVAQQTKDYVPQILALAIIISHPDEFPISFPPVSNAPYLAQVEINSQMDLKHAANLAGLSLKKLMQLNPGFSRSSTEPYRGFKLILPIENVETFTANMEHSPYFQPTAYARYKVKSGDTVLSVAKQFNTSPKLIRKMNPMVASNFRPGKNLILPDQNDMEPKKVMASQQHAVHTNEIKEFTPHYATNQPTIAKDITHAFENSEKSYTMQPGDTLYVVRLGDDLEKIARHFHTSPNALIAANQLHQRGLQLGQGLIVPTHQTVAKQETAQEYRITPGDTVYMVRPGDTIEKIASRYHTTPQVLRLANMLASNSLQEGDRLVIPTHG